MEKQQAPSEVRLEREQPSTSSRSSVHIEALHDAEYQNVLDEMPLVFRTRNQSNRLADILAPTHDTNHQNTNFHGSFELGAREQENTTNQPDIQSVQESVLGGESSRNVSNNMKSGEKKQNYRNISKKQKSQEFPSAPTKYLQSLQKPDKILTENELTEHFPCSLQPDIQSVQESVSGDESSRNLSDNKRSGEVNQNSSNTSKNQKSQKFPSTQTKYLQSLQKPDKIFTENKLTEHFLGPQQPDIQNVQESVSVGQSSRNVSNNMRSGEKNQNSRNTSNKQESQQYPSAQTKLLLLFQKSDKILTENKLTEHFPRPLQPYIQSVQESVSGGQSSRNVSNNMRSGKEYQNSRKTSKKQKSQNFPSAATKYLQSLQKPVKIFTENKLTEHFPRLLKLDIQSVQESVSGGRSSRNTSSKQESQQFPSAPTQCLQLFQKPDKIFTESKLTEHFPRPLQPDIQSVQESASGGQSLRNDSNNMRSEEKIQNSRNTSKKQKSQKFPSAPSTYRTKYLQPFQKPDKIFTENKLTEHSPRLLKLDIQSVKEAVSGCQSSSNVTDNNRSGEDNQNSRNTSNKQESQQFPSVPTKCLQSFQKPDKTFSETMLTEHFPRPLQPDIQSVQESASGGQSSRNVSDNNRSGEDNQNSRNTPKKQKKFPSAPTKYLQSFQKPDKMFNENKLIEKFPRLLYYDMEMYHNENRSYMQEDPDDIWVLPDYLPHNPDLDVYLEEDS